MYSGLKIDTSVRASGPSSSRAGSRSHTPALELHPGVKGRVRSDSTASNSSSLSIVSPTSSSTNGSSASLPLQYQEDSFEEPPSSPSSPYLEETVRLAPEYVLAMHDYAPQHQSATCLSFHAGQIIHVLNRDTSGWWDGELDGRRGWFPSNYVSSHVDSIKEEELPETPARQRPGHSHSMSTSSVTSWTTTSSGDSKRHARRPSTTEAMGSDVDSYCPPLMTDLLHGLSILQNAVRANRMAHFRPSTAYIISSVRAILTTTQCLPKDAPLLQRFPVLAMERKRILSVLAALVTQAKKASDTQEEEDNREYEIEVMLRLGGQVFAYVRRFLAVAVQCGLDLPDRRDSILSISSSTDTALDDRGRDPFPNSDSFPLENADSDKPAAMQFIANSGSNLRAKSPAAQYVRQQTREMEDGYDDAGMPLLPHRSAKKLNQAKFPLRDRIIARHRPGMSSVDSTSSSSSLSSVDSNAPKVNFPAGPTSAVQVLDALRATHDRYLSTIAAFIGHAHSHSRTSHASSTGHMYDLVREIVENVCKLLTIVEAVLQHPDIPAQKLINLRHAKDGLYMVTSQLAESVRLLTISSASALSEEDEKQLLLRSATAALKAGADCVAAVKVCLGLNRSVGGPFVINFPVQGEVAPSSPSGFVKQLPSSQLHALEGYSPHGVAEEDLTIQARTPSPSWSKLRGSSSGSDQSILSQLSSQHSEDTTVTTPDDNKPLPPLTISDFPVEPDLYHRPRHLRVQTMEQHGRLPAVPLDIIHETSVDPIAWMFLHDHPQDEVAYNSEGVLVGASLDVLVEKMTPHGSIVDHTFATVFFMTFRLFSTPLELVEKLVARYNLQPPPGITEEDECIWQRQKGSPMRLRVSNFVKTWVESNWRLADQVALPALSRFAKEIISIQYPAPAHRILESLGKVLQHADVAISPRDTRPRDLGLAINPPSAPMPSEIPRPSMTKTLLAALRGKNFASIAITDFDSLELARQLTIMECNLYCAILPDEVLETGQEGAKAPVTVKSVTTLSTLVTGWVAESILSEQDVKKRTALVKFFIKVADRCTSINNFSTSRSILAALDSSTISRLHQTWTGIPQKNKLQLEALRKLADHGRNYHEYRSRLRNTAPPAVPFLGLYLTDVTFCREGNQSYRVSPRNPNKKLINFNKYHKLARIVQDMQRFQVPYNLKAITEVHEFLNVAFENSKRNGDLQDLYRRSLQIEPKQPADAPPVSDMRQLFNWTTRTQVGAPT
ncbi:Ras-like guanine nucleotide exchange factor [Pleurotus pulmonarius]